MKKTLVNTAIIIIIIVSAFTVSYYVVPNVQAAVSQNPTSLPLNAGEKIYIGYFPHSGNSIYIFFNTSAYGQNACGIIYGNWSSSGDTSSVIVTLSMQNGLIHFNPSSSGSIYYHIYYNQQYVLIFHSKTDTIITVTSPIHIVIST
jgi:hypothetical protein